MTWHISLEKLMIAKAIERPMRAAATAYARRRIALFVRRLIDGIKRRRRLAILAKLDDLTLIDIGVSRREVQDSMRQTFWSRAHGPALEPMRWWHGGNPSLEALARLSTEQSYQLSETGQRLRREVRRPR